MALKTGGIQGQRVAGEQRLVALSAIGGAMQMFGGLRGSAIEAVMVTEFVQYPRKKVLVVLALAGAVREFAPFLAFIEHWAAMNDAEEIEAFCRESMARYTRRYGFREVRRVIRKVIERRNLQ